MRPLSRSASLRSAAVLVASSLLVACGGGSHHSHVPGPPPGPPVYTELEPNDSPYYPDRIGWVDPYSFLYVDGHVEVIGFDVVDHIEFISDRPAAYDFRIDALSAFGDVDVTIYDPVAGVVVGEYFFAGPTEYGRIVVHDYDRPFQIIVEAYGVDTLWSLELVGAPYPYYRAAGDTEGDMRDTETGASPIEALVLSGAARE